MQSNGFIDSFHNLIPVQNIQDLCGNGYISFDDFCAMVPRQVSFPISPYLQQQFDQRQKVEMEESIKTADYHGQGKVSASEMIYLFNKFGEALSASGSIFTYARFIFRTKRN